MRFNDTSPDNSTFDQTTFPRSYVASTANKYVALFVGLMFTLFAGFGLLHLLNGPPISTMRLFTLLATIWTAIMLVVAGFGMLWTFRFKLTLQAGRLDYCGPFSTQIIDRDSIASWRRRNANNRNTLELMLEGPGSKVMRIMLPFKPDAAFDAWFAGLPNADQVERQASEEDIKYDTRLGGTPEQRLASVAQARKVVRVVMFLAFACMAWAFLPIGMSTIPVGICLSMPWLALAAFWLGNGRFTLRFGEPVKENLLFFFFLPAPALVVRALQDYALVDMVPVVAVAIVVGLIMSGLLAWLGKWSGLDLRRNFPVVLFVILYAGSAVTLSNCLFDQAAPVAYPVKVLAHSRAKGRSAQAVLTVSPWGPRTTANEMTINGSFDPDKGGDTACVHLYPGAYQLAWYTLDACAPTELPVKHPAPTVAKAPPPADTAATPIPAPDFSRSAAKWPAQAGDTVLATLEKGDYATLDAQLNQRQQAFENGTSNADKALLDSFDRFFTAKPKTDSLQQHLDAWVVAYPQSYAAHLARGAFDIGKGFEARGNGYAADTSAQQFQNMQHWLSLGQAELGASAKLSKKPMLSHFYMMQSAMRFDSRQAVANHFFAASEFAPKSIELRAAYMESLTPRWGGSYEAMDAFANDSAEVLGPGADLNRLRSAILADQAGQANSDGSPAEWKASIDLYTKALALYDRAGYHCGRAVALTLLHRAPEAMADMAAAYQSPTRDPRHSNNCHYAAGSIAQLDNNAPGILDLLDRLLEEVPDDAYLLSQRGWIKQQRGLWEKAYPDYQASANLGNGWSTLMQARYVFNGWGGQTADREAGLVLLQRAIERGNDEARHCYVDALNMMGRTSEAQAAQKKYGTAADDKSTKGGADDDGTLHKIGEVFRGLFGSK